MNRAKSCNGWPSQDRVKKLDTVFEYLFFRYLKEQKGVFELIIYPDPFFEIDTF